MGVKKLTVKTGNWKVLLSIVLVSLMLTFNSAFALDDNNIVRVGITDNKFQNVLRQEITIYGTEECDLCDKATKRIITKVTPNTDIAVRQSDRGLIISIGNQSHLFQDVVLVCPTGLLGVRGLLRKGTPALYHGAFEITQKDNTGFYLVNIVELQEYLKGVVPNEMPVRFGLEALKAQAVAARNYVLTPRTQAYKEFNVVDSVASQVYFGANTEEEIATRAVMETDGIVALYNHELILALYSSTAGGYTESYSNCFSDPFTKMFPAPAKHYLTAVPDKSDFEPLDSEEKAREFYESKTPSFDIESPYYRWTKEWSGKELEDVLKVTLPAQSKTGFIHPIVREREDIGKLQDIRVLKRGKSGKIMELEICTNKGCYILAKELVIRRTFQKDGVSLPSANAVFEKKLDSYGNVQSVKVFGGGYGHGVGMSQYGAGFMAQELNKNYKDILFRYYTDIVLGTKPVVLNAENPQITQTFFVDNKKNNVYLLVDNKIRVKNIEVIINGQEKIFELESTFFGDCINRIDISKLVKYGKNVISLKLTETRKELKAYVEIGRENDENND